MRNLRFSDISLLSTKERKARRIEFHPGSNLISGLNHTGKSTVTKMLFETLGALPTGKLEGWDDAAITCVTFRVDDVKYRVLRQGDRRALFDAEGKLVTATGRSRTWIDAFSALTNFNLVLSDKNEKTAPADASCFFLPFYINQDGSWGGAWSTFKFLSRFKSPAQPILEYFSHITPPEYYRAKSARDGLQTNLADSDRELNALRRVKSRLSQALSVVGPKITSIDFENEIERLTEEINTLNQRQEGLRVTALRQNETLGMVRREITAAELTLADYKQDVHYLDRRGLDELICPTCGAEHTESFLGTLEYAEDARALESTVLGLKSNEEQLLVEIEKSITARNELDASYDELEDLLQTKKGEMQFGEIVQSLGAGNALEAFEAQERDLELKAQNLLSTIHELELEMKSYIDKKRKKEIRDQFRDAYSNARGLLNLPPANISKQQIHSRPDLSGSGGPRAILAYYAAIWEICSPNGREGFEPPSIPLVIDCPNQQGQDSKNLPAIVSFLATRLPMKAQVIVTFEGDVPDQFDRKIELSEPHGLLQQNEFEKVSQELDDLLAKMNEDLLKPKADASS